MQPALEVVNLSKRYPEFTLDGVSLSLPVGSITGLIGPSGAGKTTLIQLILDLLAPSEGHVRIFGEALAQREKELKNRIGFVGEEQLFFPGRTVAWTARFVSRFFRRWNGSLFRNLIEEFRIERSQKVRELSRGRTTLLAFAIALSHEADFLILDEPTAGLDLVARRKILGRLRRLAEDEGKTILLTSHHTAGLGEIADRIVLLDDGQVVLDEDKEDLLARWKWIHYREGALDDDLQSRLTGIVRYPFGSRGLTDSFDALRDSVAPGIEAEDIRIENASLDDVLVSLVGRE